MFMCMDKTPCTVCKAFTKIRLPDGTWVCLKTVLGSADHVHTVTYAKAA